MFCFVWVFSYLFFYFIFFNGPSGFVKKITQQCDMEIACLLSPSRLCHISLPYIDIYSDGNCVDALTGPDAFRCSNRIAISFNRLHFMVMQALSLCCSVFIYTLKPTHWHCCVATHISKLLPPPSLFKSLSAQFLLHCLLLLLVALKPNTTVEAAATHFLPVSVLLLFRGAAPINLCPLGTAIKNQRGRMLTMP